MDFKDKQKKNLLYRRRLLERQTPAEIAMKNLLVEMDVKFIPQKGFIGGKGFCIVDFYIPKPHYLCIEVDGAYHDRADQKRRDAFKRFYLVTQRGFRLVRFTNEQLLSGVAGVKEVLGKLLKR